MFNIERGRDTEDVDDDLRMGAGTSTCSLACCFRCTVMAGWIKQDVSNGDIGVIFGEDDIRRGGVAFGVGGEESKMLGRGSICHC